MCSTRDQIMMEQNTQIQLLETLQKTKLDFFWLTGGWAVDFYVGTISRPHADVDIVCRYDKAEFLKTILLKDNNFQMLERYEHKLSFSYKSKETQDLSVLYVDYDDEKKLTLPVGQRFKGVRWPSNSFLAHNIKTLNNISLPVIGLSALYQSKIYNGRKKDLLDLKAIDHLILKR